MTAVKPTGTQAVEQAVRSCYSTWGQTYYEEYYGCGAPYPPVHTRLVRNALLAQGGGRLLDAGCGPASMLRDLIDTGYELYGFDLTAEMVAEGRRVFAALGLPEDRIWEGSVSDPSAWRPSARPEFAVDAVISVGVLPHVGEADEPSVIRHAFESLAPGGLVLMQARNALFSLFTFNRYSHQFVLDELVPGPQLRQSAAEGEPVDKALGELARLFRTDLPPLRRGKQGESGYDEVLSRVHNPLLLPRLFEAAGFTEVKVLFYHFHALPPMLAGMIPAAFRTASVAMEDPEDWRGHFMASSFFVSAKKP